MIALISDSYPLALLQPINCVHSGQRPATLMSAALQAHQAALVAGGGGGGAVPQAKGQQPVSVSAASARMLWQTALRFITLTQLQQARPQNCTRQYCTCIARQNCQSARMTSTTARQPGCNVH